MQGGTQPDVGPISLATPVSRGGGSTRAAAAPRSRPWRALAAAVMGLAFASLAHGDVRYVRKDAPPGGNGLSWETAWNDLGPGLQSIFGNFAVTEIWVAAGTYVPTQQFDSGTRDRSFQMRKDLAILGGFNGTETLAAQRDPVANVTVLSGELGVVGVATDNALHVVRTNFSTSFSGLTAVLDGFTIRDGYANVNFSNVGGGLLADGSGTLRRCRLESNFASVSGGGVWAQRAMVFEDCSFVGNTNAGTGGSALQFEGNGAPLTFVDCEFVGNIGNAGAVRCQQAEFRNCLFEGNTGTGAGAVTWYGNNAQHLTLRHTVFRGNTANSNAGAISAISAGVLTVSNSAFVDNKALIDGAGALRRSTLNINDVVANTMFLGNDAAGSAGGGGVREGEITYVNCIFSGNTAALGGGIAAQNPRPIVNCTFAGNVATSGAGGLHAFATNVNVSNSLFWGNSGAAGGTQASQVVCGAASTFSHNIVQFWSGSLGGVANSAADPLFIAPLGVDGVVGSEDDDLRVGPGSPAIDSGKVAAVPADTADVDDDLNVAEVTALDVDGTQRFVDDPNSADTGQGTAPIVDRGAQEFDPAEFDPTIHWVGPRNGSWFDPANWSSGVVPLPRSEVLISSGTVIVGSGVAVAASIEIGGGATLSVSGGAVDADSITVAGSGTLGLDGANATAIVNELTVLAGGAIDWNGGTLTIESLLTAPAPFEVGCDGGGTLVLVNATADVSLMTICAGGRLAGAGHILGGVANHGEVTPGFEPFTEALGPGQILVDEAFVQSATGTLRLPLTGFGRYANDSRLIAATAQIDGTIGAYDAGGSEPEVHADQVVLSARSIAGNFASEAFPIPPAPFVYLHVASPTEIRLRSKLATSGARLYVAADAGPGGDGQSWRTATSSLKSALRAADDLDGGASDIDEIWVKSGVHTPADDTLGPDDTFELFGGVSVFGGFAGTENELSERDPVRFPTILSADILGNDDPNPKNPEIDPSRDDNAGPVITAHGFTELSRLDGLTIMDGYSDLFGSGVDALDANLEIVGCILTDNAGPAAGGLSGRGASTLTVTNTSFLANWGDSGPDIRIIGPTALHVANCEFAESRAANSFPPVVHLTTSSVPATIVDCQFLGSVRAGGIHANRPLLVQRCSFSDYISTAIRGSGPYDMRIEDSICEGPAGAGILCDQNCHMDLVRCTIAGYGSGDGYSLRGEPNGVIHAVNCTIAAGVAAVGGGLEMQGATALLEGCLLLGNRATVSGGGILSTTSNLTLRYCTVFANEAPTGGGITAAGDPSGSITVEHSILWKNLDEGKATLASQLNPGNLPSTAIAVNNSIVQHIVRGVYGRGNSAADPLFVDELGPDFLPGTGDEDCALFALSPAINAAAAGSLPLDTLDVDADGDVAEPLPVDLRGNPRLYGPAADLGAFEFVQPADLDGNGAVDGADLAILLGGWGTGSADLTGDGTTDGADLAVLLGAWTG